MGLFEARFGQFGALSGASDKLQDKCAYFDEAGLI